MELGISSQFIGFLVNFQIIAGQSTFVNKIYFYYQNIDLCFTTKSWIISISMPLPSITKVILQYSLNNFFIYFNSLCQNKILVLYQITLNMGSRCHDVESFTNLSVIFRFPLFFYFKWFALRPIMTIVFKCRQDIPRRKRSSWNLLYPINFMQGVPNICNKVMDTFLKKNEAFTNVQSPEIYFFKLFR